MRSSHSGENYTLSQESLRLKDIGHEFGHMVVWELLNRPAYPDFGCLNDDYDDYDEEDSPPRPAEDGGWRLCRGDPPAQSSRRAL